jgi:single-stranded DNA-binding protein
MTRSITVAGELASMPEYQEAPAGKLAAFAVTVTTRHRDLETGDWVTDPPVTYQVVAAGDEGLAVAASLAPGDRVLLSGTLRDDTTPATIDAETIEPGAHFQHGA